MRIDVEWSRFTPCHISTQSVGRWNGQKVDLTGQQCQQKSSKRIHQVIIHNSFINSFAGWNEISYHDTALHGSQGSYLCIINDLSRWRAGLFCVQTAKRVLNWFKSKQVAESKLVFVSLFEFCLLKEMFKEFSICVKLIHTRAEMCKRGWMSVSISFALNSTCYFFLWMETIDGMIGFLSVFKDSCSPAHYYVISSSGTRIRPICKLLWKSSFTWE